MKKKNLATCLVGLTIILGSIMPTSGSAVLTADETSTIIGGCNTAICENWWCPYGTSSNVLCDQRPCVVGPPDPCPCSVYAEQVSRVAYPTGGTAISAGVYLCGQKLACECWVSDFKCYTIPTETCGMQGSYSKCVNVP